MMIKSLKASINLKILFWFLFLAKISLAAKPFKIPKISTLDYFNEQSLLNLPKNILFEIFTNFNHKDQAIFSLLNFEALQLAKEYYLLSPKIYIDKKKSDSIFHNSLTYEDRVSCFENDLELNKIKNFQEKTLQNYLEFYLPKKKNRLSLNISLPNEAVKELIISEKFNIYLSDLNFIAKWFPNLESLTIHNFEMITWDNFNLMKNLKKLHIIHASYTSLFSDLPQQLESIQIDHLKVVNEETFDGNCIDYFFMDLADFSENLFRSKQKKQLNLKKFSLINIDFNDTYILDSLMDDIKENVKIIKEEFPEISIEITVKKNDDSVSD